MDLVEAERLWGREFLPDLELIDRTLAVLDMDPASRVLDVGTGWGIMAISLAAQGFDVITGEPDEVVDREDHDSAYGDWRRSARSVGLQERIRYQPLDALKLPFPSASFHGVFLYDTLQHIENRARALVECLRVTEPDGVLCVIETNDRGVAHYRDSEGFEITRLDPRAFLEDARVSTEVVSGALSDAFLIRPTTRS